MDPTDRPALRLEYRRPSELAEHPANWKHHPPEQLRTIEELHGRVGPAGALLLNERTGRLLDGHGRRELLAARGDEPFPVLVGSWSDEEERLILAGLDPSGWMAISDRRKLDELLKAPMPELRTDDFKGLMDAVKASSKLLDQVEGPEPDGRPDDVAEVSIPLDSLWPSDNPWSVPALLPELAADQVPGPVQTWGTIGARRPMPGTWHFYVHDRKFEPLWRRTHRVLYSRPAAAVEPNFSTTDQTPFALNLWNTYRKRWIARYWQASGLRVLVDLNVDASLNAPCEALGGARMNLLGVPAGWSAFASRAHGNRPEALEAEWRVAREHSGRDHPLFLVVGGGRRVKALAEQHGWVWVPEQIQQAHQADPDGDG